MILLIFGGNSGAKLVIDYARQIGYSEFLLFDNYTSSWENFDFTGITIFSGDSKLNEFLNFDYFIATGDNTQRSIHFNSLFKIFKKQPVNIIHPSAIISNNVKLGFGNLICPRVVINNSSEIGNGNIINTGCIIEHDNFIGDFSQLSPGSILAGYVRIGNYCFIGSGASIIPKCKIGHQSIIGAGSVVITDIPNKITAVGVPAKEINKK